jgi:Family of unknown function (DUF5681)
MNKQKLPDPVGYKHPPRANQFHPGHSGNPAGRPKGARSLKADLRDELGELISFGEGSQSVELSKQRVLIKKLVGAAIEGDARAVATVLSITLRALGEDDCAEPEEAPEDREILQAFASCSTKSSPSENDIIGKRNNKDRE